MLSGRSISPGSVFSTSLISRVVNDAIPRGTVDLLIDVGCGGSPYRFAWNARRYVGVDRSPDGADGMVVGDAASVPLADGIAGGVLCTEVIEHVPDERLLAEELARIAAPGAVLVLSAPFVHALHEQPYDFRRLTSIGLVTVLTDAGWEVEQVASIGGSLVVAIDSFVRWTDSRWRIAVGLVFGRSRPAQALATVPTRTLQRVAAAVTLRWSRHLGPIDAFRPRPRLTLGYVVRAVRRP